jgi:capsule polysaccharide export protein KpsE/RkpR
MYVALLRTRRVQDALIARFDLKARYNQETLSGTRAVLGNRVDIKADKKSGLITINVDDLDATFAANLANAHVDELRKVMTGLAITDAQQRRAFFEQQVSQAKAALAKAEIAFRQAQTASGFVVSQALAEVGVREGARVRGQIASREVQLRSLTQFTTAENPDVRRLTAELSALRQQLQKIEQGGGAASGADQEHGMVAVQAYRDVKVQEALLETLIRQYELARSDEAREGPLLQQVDIATPPERALKPKRLYVALAGGVASLLVGLLVALLSAKISRLRSDESAGEWRKVLKAWS